LAPGAIKAAFRTKQNNEPFFLKYINGVVREGKKCLSIDLQKRIVKITLIT